LRFNCHQNGPNHTSTSPQELTTQAAAFLLPYIFSARSHIGPFYQDIRESADPIAAEKYELEIAALMIHRRVIVTQTGLYGLGPSTAREGHLCCVIFGAKIPFIVKPIADSNEQYELVGEAYIHGIMKGEVVKMCDDGKFQEQDIIPV
jgi:hypothetical protein